LIEWSVPWFDCDESLTWRGLNSNPKRFSSFTIILVSFGESYLLISWYVGGRCGMVGSDEDYSRSRRPGAEDRGWSATGQVLGGRTIRRPGDAMCDLHHT
jgi:hypothetical protein